MRKKYCNCYTNNCRFEVAIQMHYQDLSVATDIMIFRKGKSTSRTIDISDWF